MIHSLKFNRIIIAGTGSNCGKTTITCALLKALMNKGLKVASFKTGPDFIDPMFHTRITGTKSRNLDMLLCGEDTTKQLFAKNSQGMDISVVEGVMGLYDGLGMNSMDYSSNDLSMKTDTPVILVVNCKGMGRSVAALIKGYLEFAENNIKGVILNGISSGMYPYYKELIENNNEIKVLGFIPNLPEVSIESRHLGLVTADEIDDLKSKIEILANIAKEYIDLDGLIELASGAPTLFYEGYNVEKLGKTKIAIARDNAFSFYYEDVIDLLKELGAEIISFSPIHDKSLPKDIGGLVIGGGYPELYLEELAKNHSMLNSIRSTITKGIPTYAESGGFIYLGKTIEGSPMVNLFEANSVLTEGLQNFGYINLQANEDNILCKKGESIKGHEFHYTRSDFEGESFTATKISTGKKRTCILAEDNIFAGFPHLNLWGNVNFAKNFVKKCIEYSSKSESRED